MSELNGIQDVKHSIQLGPAVQRGCKPRNKYKKLLDNNYTDSINL